MDDGGGAHSGSNRFKYPLSPQDLSMIHEDVAASHHPSGRLSDGDRPSMLRRVLPHGRKLHVGIVGGGVAGLRCAAVLQEHGVQVTILEARDRLGGRLAQATLKGGHVVDLGPNWIHGTENNPMMDLAKETGTVVTEWGEEQVCIDSDKTTVPPDQVREASAFFWTGITEAFKESSPHFTRTRRKELIPVNKSLADFFEEKIAALPNSGANSEKAGLLRKTYRTWDPYVGQPIERQSLKFFWLEECLEGENFFCASSYSKILDHLAEPVRKDTRVLYEREMVRVISRDDTPSGKASPAVLHRRRSPNGQQAVSAPFPDDTEEETAFDEVVVTTPLGWLKQHPEAFEPQLPSRMQEAIRDLGYGSLDKVYITFPVAWWNGPLEALVAAQPADSQRTAPNVKATTTQHPSVDSASSINPCYPATTLFLQPEYARDTNPTLQNQEICNLACLPGPTAQPTLLFYIYGAFARSVADAVSPLPHRHPHRPASEAYIAALWPFFEPYVSQLPSYDPSRPDCRPADALATAWADDDLAGNGSYTNFPTGLGRGDGDVLALREGLPGAGVWFAGEHTAPFVALGTVTGAYWAGEAVAGRIVAAYGIGAEDSRAAR